MREACVRLFSLLHRANFVSVSPHPGRFLHYFWLSLSLSGSLRACFFYIRSVDEERILSFPFFFLFGLSLRSFVRSKRCAGEYSAFSFFFPKLCLILKNRFLARLSSNFQERLLMKYFMPQFIFGVSIFSLRA